MPPSVRFGQALPIGWLVHGLTLQLDRPVIDKTDLRGIYDFKLEWTPVEGGGAMFKGPEDQPGMGNRPSPEASGPSLFTAIQEQLGLKLESKKGPVEILVIDHAEQPSGN